MSRDRSRKGMSRTQKPEKVYGPTAMTHYQRIDCPDAEECTNLDHIHDPDGTAWDTKTPGRLELADTDPDPPDTD